MRTRTVIVIDHFVGPLARDLDHMTRGVVNALRSEGDVMTLCAQGAVAGSTRADKRWGVARGVRETLLHFDPDHVVYVPHAGGAVPLFTKAAALVKTVPLAAHAMIIPTPPRPTRLGAALRWLYPGRIHVGSYRSALELSKLSLEADAMPQGVDREEFRRPSSGESSAVRVRYGIARDTFAFLLCDGGPRWRDTAGRLADIDPSIVVVVLGGEDGDADARGKQPIHDRIRVLPETDAGRELYWLSDGVVSMGGRVTFEAPANVIEALACGVPVLSAAHTSWRDFLREGEDLRFFSDADELGAFARSFLSADRDRVRTVDGFAWREVARQVLVPTLLGAAFTPRDETLVR